MTTSAVQLDPNEMRNLAISLGSNAPPPSVAAPISMPPPQAPPNLGISTSAPHVNAPRGTIAGDTAERGRLLSTGAGEDQIYGKITNSNFGQQHPTISKILGGLGEGIAKAGDIGLSAVAPALAINLPGTEYHHQAQLNQVNRQIGTETKEGEQQAQTASDQSEIPMHQAQVEHENAATQDLLHPELKPKEETWKELAGYTGANGEPLEIEQNSGNVRPVAVPGAKQTTKPEKESNPQQQTYDSLIKGGLSPIQAYEKIREKPAGTTINEGTWSLQEDANGKPILLNSKTGEAKAAPEGIAKSGTHAKAEAAIAPVKQALDYAEEYGNRNLHTGPGDEALMEKFFELAKPSTGFRMSQPQIDMLKNAQSWMGGLEAHLRHATTGTWFSDEQRQQIVNTMRDLGKVKGLGSEASPQAAQPAKGGAQNDPLGIR